MNHLMMSIKQVLFLSLFSFLIFFPCFSKLFAEEINWTLVAKTDNEIQYIDINSINYNSNGLLSVMTKYNEIDPDNQTILNTNSFLMAIDCDNRLFSKLPLNGEIKQIKHWNKPINDKLIKKTILNSCSY